MRLLSKLSSSRSSSCIFAAAAVALSVDEAESEFADEDDDENKFMSTTAGANRRVLGVRVEARTDLRPTCRETGDCGGMVLAVDDDVDAGEVVDDSDEVVEVKADEDDEDDEDTDEWRSDTACVLPDESTTSARVCLRLGRPLPSSSASASASASAAVVGEVVVIVVLGGGDDGDGDDSKEMVCGSSFRERDAARPAEDE